MWVLVGCMRGLRNGPRWFEMRDDAQSVEQDWSLGCLVGPIFNLQTCNRSTSRLTKTCLAQERSSGKVRIEAICQDVGAWHRRELVLDDSLGSKSSVIMPTGWDQSNILRQ